MNLSTKLGAHAGTADGLRAALRLLILVLVTALPAGAARAQGPAGNEHPQRQALAQGGLANPFGDVEARPSARTPEQTRAFMQALDLSPLADLSLYHNGRVKILGTLARETVSEVLGRKDYVDYVPEAHGATTRWRKVHHDALFTFLDTMIEPGYYHERPLVGVNYLPLREALLERAFPGEDPQAVEARERWKKIGRLSPAMLAAHAPGLASAATLDPQINSGLNDINEAIGLYLRSAGNLMMVAPQAKSEPWAHLSSLPEGHPVRAAALALGKAWRAGDAPGVNSAAKVLAAELPRLGGPGVYPTTRRALESFYGRTNLFEWGMWLYCLSLLALLLAFGTGRSWLRRTGLLLLIGAVIVHALGFGLRSYIAERYAIQNQFESMTGVSLFAAIVGLVLLITRKQLVFAAGAAGAGFIILIAATQTGIPGQDVNREAAILNTSVLLKYHVTTVLVSYGLITLGLFAALFYLGAHYLGAKGATTAPALAGAGASAVAGAGASDDAPAPGARAAMLHDLDKAHVTILQLAFWTLGVGILLGAWWADHSWGRWWAFDPKELWALLTWIVYLIVIHVRIAGVKNRGLVTAWLSVLGFLVMLWCYFGVNLLLPGLHAYA